MKASVRYRSDDTKELETNQEHVFYNNILKRMWIGKSFVYQKYSIELIFHSDLSTRAIVAVSVGIAVGTIVILLTIMFWLWRKGYFVKSDYFFFK